MDEYIDREKFRKHVHEVTNDQNCPMYIAVTVEQYIDAEPAADVAPGVHAQPVFFFDDPVTGRRITTCSNCDGKIGKRDRYCKHCGAKMEGDRNATD